MTHLPVDVEVEEAAIARSAVGVFNGLLNVQVAVLVIVEVVVADGAVTGSRHIG